MKQKKLLVDAISLLSPSTGIGRYTYEISNHIEKSNIFELNYFYGYYSKKLLAPNEKSNSKRLKSIFSKNQFFKKLVRQIAFSMSKITSKHYDIYFQPNFIVNSNIKTKKIVTAVHDFSFILYKDFHPKERIEYFESYFMINILKSDCIICFSEYTKQEIVEKLSFPEHRVKVIYHGIKKNIFNVKNNINTTLELPENFILSVGSIEPRKNLLGLLKAYSLLKNTIKDKYKLVLVGFQGWENTEIMALINSNKHIKYLGYISDEELSNVYNLATAFIFPSFYEGFGFPPLEAMSCGTPVIASNVTSIPEVCDDAALYFNPYNAEDIKNKIELLLNNIDLQIEMTIKGLKRASEFTWEKSVKEHIKVFNNL